jgi:hypothetical protein
LLPAWYVPRRSCGIGVIGAAIAAHLESGHGHARIAAGLGVAPATVRGWLRGLKGAAAAVYDLARQACRGGVGYVWRPERPLRPTFDESVPEVLRALDELALVALAFTRPDPPHRVGGATGIDYIHLLGQQQRRDHNRLLRLIDPTDDRPALGLWPAINVISGGRLLAVITARIVPAAPV